MLALKCTSCSIKWAAASDFLLIAFYGRDASDQLKKSASRYLNDVKSDKETAFLLIGIEKIGRIRRGRRGDKLSFDLWTMSARYTGSTNYWTLRITVAITTQHSLRAPILTLWIINWLSAIFQYDCYLNKLI